MGLDPELVKILRCPKCKGELVLEPDEVAFDCEPCHLRYLVENGIPNFLINEARPLEASGKGQ
jgi:uncharacterized protein YbaR (Trm112 family)